MKTLAEKERCKRSESVLLSEEHGTSLAEVCSVQTGCFWPFLPFSDAWYHEMMDYLHEYRTCQRTVDILQGTHDGKSYQWKSMIIAIS